MFAGRALHAFPKPEYALGFHVWSTGAAGTVMVPQRIAMSSADSVDVVVHGVGTHGASPHRGVDPDARRVADRRVAAVAREPLDRSLEAGVVTVGAIHGGTRHNIIGDRVDLQLTVRADNYETRGRCCRASSASRMASRARSAYRGQAARSDSVEDRDDAADVERRADGRADAVGVQRALRRGARAAGSPRRHGWRGLRPLRRARARRQGACSSSSAARRRPSSRRSPRTTRRCSRSRPSRRSRRASKRWSSAQCR